MKYRSKLFLGVFLYMLTISNWLYAQQRIDQERSVIGVQAYTFRLFTFEQALQKVLELGLKHIEIYPGQKLQEGSELTTHFSKGGDNVQAIKTLLERYDIVPYAYGVVKADSEEEWNAIFSFVRSLGITVINAEPILSHLDMVEKLAEKYQIRVALHNHPVPSTYWHPKTVAELLKGRSAMLGVCADIGHWVRSGLDPLECIDMLGDRVMGFHFKDINGFGNRKAHDVPWGTGYCNLSTVLNDMKKKEFKGYFTIEYEYNWKNNLPEIAESLIYFNRFDMTSKR